MTYEAKTLDSWSNRFRRCRDILGTHRGPNRAWIMANVASCLGRSHTYGTWRSRHAMGSEAYLAA